MSVTSRECLFSNYDLNTGGYPPRSHNPLPQTAHQINGSDGLTAGLEGQTPVLRKSNTVQPLIHNLPAEILSHIFQLVCSPATFDPLAESEPAGSGQWSAHTTLNRVCRYWREIMVSTPQLWTHLILHMEPTTFDVAVSLLLRFLNRSGDLPLTLVLSFHHDLTIPFDTLIHESVDALLLKSFPRIRRLDLLYPPATWLSPSLPFLNQLTHLRIGFIQTPQLLAFSAFPCLSHLHLVRVWSPIALASPQQITVLHMETTPIDVCAAILPQCPNLVDFQSKRPHYVSNRNTLLPPSGRVTFQNMKVFGWEVLSGDTVDTAWQSAVLNNIHLPSLQILFWSHLFHNRLRYPAYGDTANGFFDSLPTTLTTLVLSSIQIMGADGDYSETIATLRNDTDINHIVFAECRLTFIRNVLSDLTPRTHTQIRFPKLHKITIEKMPIPGIETMKFSRIIWNALIEMLTHRMRISNVALSLHLNHSPGLVLSTQDQQRLNDLKSRGIQLEIFVNSEPVSWWT